MRKLSGNQLKIIAMVAMTLDHLGVVLFPQCQLLRIIGRLALPVYAFMIAEGCKYTKSKLRYFLSVFGLAMVCQLVYLVAEGSLYQSVLVAFSLSILWIYAIDFAKRKKNVVSWLPVVAMGIAIWFLSVTLPSWIKGSTGYYIDYGWWGIVLPVAVYLAPGIWKAPATALALLPLCLERGGNQWWSMAAAVMLLFYSGKRGKWNIKYLFYIYYPAHLAIIYFIDILI